MQRMLESSGFKDPDELLQLMPKIEEDVGPRLVALILYHILPGGAWTDGQLAGAHGVQG